MNHRVLAVVVSALALLAGISAYVVLQLSPSGPSRVYESPATCSTVGPGGPSNGTVGNWTTYHGNNSRSGNEPSASPHSVHRLWSAPVLLDGQAYAEPLVCGDSVYVATEGDSVYSFNATSGALHWHTNLGLPVPGSALPCGDIDPSGITGTPVIDVAARMIYVVAFLDLTPFQHVLFGLSTTNGSVESRIAVDPPGADPSVEQQRGALALANGYVYVPYGGLYGDCGSYHGWVVAVRTTGSPAVLSYEVPAGRAGGIWSPAGITVAPGGDLYVATGNSDATTTFDFGDSVIELSPTLKELQYFAPTNWAYLNSHDADLGTVSPTVLPNGDVFQVGKVGVGYLLSGTNLGGVGGQVASATVCGSAYGGTARVGSAIFVPCLDGVAKVFVGPNNLTVAWKTSAFSAGGPIVTGPIVWAVNTSRGDLLGFNASTGQEVYAFTLGSADHFCTPAATPNGLFVAAGNQLVALAFN